MGGWKMEKLYQIFIANDAWITICKGIGVTVEISLVSLLAGTLLGALICFFRMGKSRWTRYGRSHPSAAAGSARIVDK